MSAQNSLYSQRYCVLFCYSRRDESLQCRRIFGFGAAVFAVVAHPVKAYYIRRRISTILPIYYYYYIIVCGALMGTPRHYTHFHGPVRYFTRVGTQRYTIIIIIIIFIVGCRIV